MGSFVSAGQKRPDSRGHPHGSVYSVTPQAWKEYTLHTASHYRHAWDPMRSP